MEPELASHLHKPADSDSSHQVVDVVEVMRNAVLLHAQWLRSELVFNIAQVSANENTALVHLNGTMKQLNNAEEPGDERGSP
jgi:hypothetical protein